MSFSVITINCGRNQLRPRVGAAHIDPAGRVHIQTGLGIIFGLVGDSSQTEVITLWQWVQRDAAWKQQRHMCVCVRLEAWTRPVCA